MSVVPRFHLGAFRTFEDPPIRGQAHMPAHHCCTHVVTLGATGSGKTGVTLVMVEEALRNGVPVLMIDVKGGPTQPAVALSPAHTRAAHPVDRERRPR
jgi:type IV secretory pathway VirB4 component